MRSILLLVTGVLMLISAVAHGGLGWPMMRTELEKAGVGEGLTGALGAGWHFGSAAMVVFGLIVLTSGLKLKRGDTSGAMPVLLISIGYLAFGVYAFFERHFNPHFLLFVFTGLLGGVPVLGIMRGRAKQH